MVSTDFSGKSSGKRTGGLGNPALIGLALLCFAIVIAIFFPLFSGEAEDIVFADAGGVPASSSESSHEISKHSYVHVTGCVASPGVVDVAAGARVIDAIEAAGGFIDGADTEALNLARPLSDGEQIIVPSLADREGQASSQGGGSSIENAPSSAYIGSRLNINRASQDELESLPGIGPSIAARIIEERETNGPFSSVQDIMRVSGIGEKKYARIEGSICVG